MAGMLTPIPHTPLAERLRVEGRLNEAEYSGNNTDDEVQFQPLHMSVSEMQQSYYRMLKQLFGPGAMYHRSRALLARLEPHIFRGDGGTSHADMRAAFRSLWRQGIVRAPRRDYLRLLWTGWRRDRTRRKEATHEQRRVRRQLRELSARASATGVQRDSASLLALLDRAHDALLRSRPDRPIAEIASWRTEVKERIEAGRPTPVDLQALYQGGEEFFVRQRRLHRFPGAYLVKAFNLAIKGLHYEIVMDGIVPDGSGELRV
jgi:hypothetical protein